MKYKPKNGEKVTFQILFTSDVHGAFRDFNYALNQQTPTAGLSRLAPLMKKDKKGFVGQTFIVDCGDSIQGNGTNIAMKEVLRFQPFPLLHAYDVIGYDMTAIGNHEFNFGIPALYQAFKGYKGDKLCGNVFDEKNNYLEGFKPYSIKTLDCGLKIAFIGMVSPNITIWDKKHMNVGDKSYHASNAAIETRRIIDYLKSNQLADVFILLGHMDEDNELDTLGSGANDIIKENPELAVFLGAHFHMIKGTKEKQLVLNNSVKFVENLNSAASYGKVLITATYVGDHWDVVNKTGDYDSSDVKTDVIVLNPDIHTENDNDVLNATQIAHDFIRNYMQNTIIGHLKGGALVPKASIKGTHEVILQPTPLIEFISSVMLRYTKADIVGVAPSTFDVNCDEGSIKQGDIAKIYVYDNSTLYKLSMTGKQIHQWIEWSYAYFGTTKDGVLDLSNPAVNLKTDLTIPYGTRKVYLYDQFKGINYTVDLTKPVGQRIHIVSMQNGDEFIMDKEYTVATANYRATTNLLNTSKDGIFKPGEKTAELIEMDVASPLNNTNMFDLIYEYIQEQPNMTIYNSVEKNWHFINLNWDTKAREEAIIKINNGSIPYDYRKPIKKHS